MCIIVGFQKLIIHGRDVDVVGWQKGGRIWATKELKQNLKQCSAIAVAGATIAVAILKQR